MSTPRQMYDDYRYFHTITTRWVDNDAYDHVNNVVYYSYFDTVVNAYLVKQGILNPKYSNAIDLAIETQYNYFTPLSLPNPVVAGLRVARLGDTSVRYEVGLFRGDIQEMVAQGHFVRVHIDREMRRPVTLPDTLRTMLKPLASNTTA